MAKTSALLVLLLAGITPLAEPPEPWRFDPNALRITAPAIAARIKPLGDMHGIVIEKLGDAPSPTVEGRAFLNLEHYLAKGRYAEYLPRKLDQTATLTRDRVTVHFPVPGDWPVGADLTYTFAEPGAIDARLDFGFTDKLTQFEVYFTSYFAGDYERFVRIDKKWVRPEISSKEQLLIPRDDKIASRYEDGRWEFLKGRTRLAAERFDLPVIISRSEKTGWTIAQMIEPGTCTHIAPNRFAAGHNFVIGGWDVKQGDKRSARIRLIAGHQMTDEQVEKAYERFADDCRKSRAAATTPPAG